jgi:hypothetical protein
MISETARRDCEGVHGGAGSSRQPSYGFFRDGSEPTWREVAHYFFASAPIELHGRRLEGALRAADRRAPAALALMNEALATAIGNGVLEEKLRGDNFQAYLDQSFYAADDVDAAAKAILPLVRDYLGSNRPMDRQFIDRYFSLVIERLGQKLDSLEARLRVSGYVAGDSELYKTMNEATGWLDSRSVWHANLDVDGLEDAVLTRHTYLNGVVLTSVRDRGKLSSLVPSIDRLRLPAGSAAIGLHDGARVRGDSVRRDDRRNRLVQSVAHRSTGAGSTV